MDIQYILYIVLQYIFWKIKLKHFRTKLMGLFLGIKYLILLLCLLKCKNIYVLLQTYLKMRVSSHFISLHSFSLTFLILSELMLEVAIICFA